MSDISYSKFLIKSKFNPKKAKKYMESYDKIMESGLFDKKDKNSYKKHYRPRLRAVCQGRPQEAVGL